jgi:ParB/RepB/Spo0J family partition protein
MSQNAARQGMALRGSVQRAPELSVRGDLLWIPGEYIQPDPDQPRRDFDEESLTQLADNISSAGLLVPLRVRPANDQGLHTITDGERRWRAGSRVGLVEYPCLVEAADSATAFFEAYSANLHRDALTLVDAAVGLQRIRELFGLASDGEVAARVQKSVGWVRQMNAVIALDVHTRRVMQERGEPIAVAVALRPQSAPERLSTLDAVAHLESRDEKLEMIARINDQRRAGSPIEAAIEFAGKVVDREPEALDTQENRKPAPRVGRPTRVTLPFTWRETAAGTQLDVAPSALATTRLARQRTVAGWQWRDGLREDLVTFRDACAATEGSEGEWAQLVEMLRGVIDTE